MYTLTQHNSVIRNSDNSYIPFDTGNTDYQQYLKWIEEGNTPNPYIPPPPPPELTPMEKLTNAGLSVDELKSLLGL